MNAAVIVFPGSNCDRDVATALEQAMGKKPIMAWHGNADLPQVDLVVLPGGFSYGDYLRCGAMAAQSPVMREVVARAKSGTPVLGICNGFQVLTETGLLPGALMRNASLKFVCRDVTLRVEAANTKFTSHYAPGSLPRMTVAHGDGNYFADAATLDELEQSGRVALRYVDDAGQATPEANPNGSARSIAGILNAAGNVLGMMPHPERHADPLLGGTDGKALFSSLVQALS